MGLIRIPRVRPGDPITDGLYNAMAEALERADLSFASSGYFCGLKDPHGVAIALVRAEWMKIRLTSNSGNHFAWTQVWAEPGGTWSDGNLSGTTSDDYAAELNGEYAVVAAALPLVVWSWTSGGKRLFQAGSC